MSLTLLSFKTPIKWPLVLTATKRFPRVFSQLLCFSFKLFGSRGCLDDRAKTDFCSYHILTSSAIYYCTATWNLFVKSVSLLLLSPNLKSLTVWHESQAAVCLFEVCANKTETLHCLHTGSGFSVKMSSEFLPAVDSHVLRNGEKNILPCGLRLICPAETTVKK